MKTKTVFLLLSVLVLTALLTSCASYTASPLCSPSLDLILTAPVNEKISVVSKAFTKEDCNRFLDRDVIAEGYQPVQIYIQNESDKSYIFSPSCISLPIARPEEVADKVHTSTLGRAVGYGAGALVLWPLIIPAIVDGLKSSEANTALDTDFAAKAARDRIIFPHSSLNAIIFVPSNAYEEVFSLTLMDRESNQPKTFNLVAKR